MDIFLFLAVLVVLIVVHELGHFLAAKSAGIRVDEFGVGFPPRLAALFRKGETLYTLNWLPFGGFVKIFGEDPNDEALQGPERHRAFSAKKKPVQIFVLAAGVLFNILLAWILFFGIFLSGVPTALSGDERGTVRDERLQVIEVLPNSPAERAGFEAGDTIARVSFGEQDVQALTSENVTAFIDMYPGQDIRFVLLHAGAEREVFVSSAQDVLTESPERFLVGISMTRVGIVSYSPFDALIESSVFTFETLGAIVVALSQFFASAFTLSADLSQIAGPVGIVGLVGDAASLGLVPLFMFTAFISLNLAVINLLPVPALDGGRILFVLIEAIKGSPIRPSILRGFNMLGFVLLILLMLVVTYNDIIRIAS